MYLLTKLYTPPHTPHLTLHTSHSTPHTPHLTLHTSHSTPHTPHLTLHTSHSTPHTPHLTLHTSHSTPHTPHLTHPYPHCIHQLLAPFTPVLVRPLEDLCIDVGLLQGLLQTRATGQWHLDVLEFLHTLTDPGAATASNLHKWRQQKHFVGT